MTCSSPFAPAGADRLQRLLLIVDDIEAARRELVDRGIEVGEIFRAGGVRRWRARRDHGRPVKPPDPGRL
jgi:hypothetical protein